jgi:predicted transcriptional regulator
MARSSQDVTDTELAILQALWEQGSASRRQITDRLYPHGGTAQYATVQKLLERLESKGYVAHAKHEGMLIFRPLVPREQLIHSRLQDMAEKLCGGEWTPLLMTLVRGQRLSAKELQELQELIEQQGPPGKRKGGRR